jgi:hypothetical protein
VRKRKRVHPTEDRDQRQVERNVEAPNDEVCDYGRRDRESEGNEDDHGRGAGQGCFIGRLSGKSRPKDVVRARLDDPASGRTSESADRWRTAQADGTCRISSPAAERTATLQKNSQEHHNIL